MELTSIEIEAMLANAWGHPASINRYRLSGNGGAWRVEDHNGHSLAPRIHRCADGQVRLTPAAMDRPTVVFEAVGERAGRCVQARGDAAARRRMG